MFNEQQAQRRDEDEDYEMEESGNNGGIRSRFGRWFNQMTGSGAAEEDDEAYEDGPAARPVSGGVPFVGTRGSHQATAGYAASGTATASNVARSSTFRIASAREGSITVMPVATFADVQKAADRLKAGEPQIINLEKTEADIAERLVDFLNGVTYALDGYVEKVSEGAYLFTPSHIAIHADGPEAAPPRARTFFDRIS